MKLSLMILAALMTAVLWSEGDGDPQVIFFSHEKVAKALATNEVLLKTPSLLVIGSHRAAAAKPTAHAHEAEVFYVIDGEATIITGGTMVNKREISPGEFEGTELQGGETHHLMKGDVLVYPAGTPHWWKEIPHSISYFVVGIITGTDVPPVTFFGHDKVSNALAASVTLVKASDLLVMGSHRAEAGHVEVHDKETDVFYVVDGEATLVTGGKMEGGIVASPGQWRGTSIQGGEDHHLIKGDVIVIPAGIPHWYKEVPKSITYFVVKMVKP